MPGVGQYKRAILKVLPEFRGRKFKASEFAEAVNQHVVFKLSPKAAIMRANNLGVVVRETRNYPDATYRWMVK